MNVTDELDRLSKLHKEGSLTDQEFSQAKNMLLSQPTASAPVAPKSTPDAAADSSIGFWIAIALVGALIVLGLLFGITWPRGHRWHHFFHWQ